MEFSAAKDLIDELKIDKQKMLKIGQDLLLAEIKKRAPKDTGKYAKSFKAKKPTKHTATIETPEGFLHILLEYTGAIPHDIYPVRAKALHWEDPPGTHHFRKHVFHPGFKPIPHVRPAINHILPIWKEQIVNSIMED